MTKHEQVVEKCLSKVDQYEWENADLVKQYFSKLLVPNILYSANLEEKNVDPLTSRVGGKPMVPENFEWPTVDYGVKAPLAFFFQLNLSEISRYDQNNRLPKEGILACFVGVCDDAMHDPACVSARKIFYFKDIDSLSAQDFPAALPDEEKLEAKKIEFHASYEVAFEDELYEKKEALYSTLGELEEDDSDGIWDVSIDILNDGIFEEWKFSETGENMFSFYRILGSYDSNIIYKWAGLENEEEEAFSCLLSMRFDKAEGFGFKISDADLYLCISKDDLQKGNLEKTRVLIENS